MKNQPYKYDPGSGAGSSGFGIGGDAMPTNNDGFAPPGTWDDFQSTFNQKTSTTTSSPSGQTGELTDFPEWMQPDISELESEYANVGDFFKIGGKLKPLQNLADAQYSQGLQQGANAGSEAIARAFQNGIVGSNVNTSLISAQTAMPALMAKMGAEANIGEMRIQNMYRQQAARAALANQIASQRQQYVNTLANYSLGQQGLNLQSQNMQQSFGLQNRRQNFVEQQYSDQQNQGASYGELANIMTSANQQFPQAASFWQQFGAGLGEYGDNQVNIGFGGATNPGGGGFKPIVNQHQYDTPYARYDGY